ncbi:MAG: hypothetical protein M1834_004310 [Cirrosporium novae-zelandiae]|nr:MAG: hypothetical protein M1834_004310 [Cirrosporium novae-zelandiae]
MVHTGKPSRACQPCKSRHIRCDESTPACNNCVRSGRICPGYKSEFDLVLRDQNAVAHNNVQRRLRKQQKKRDDRRVVPQKEFKGVGKSTSIPTLPTSISISKEFEAICFLFTRYILVQRDPGTRTGFLEFLPPLYAKSNPSSSLSTTTSALALSIMEAWTSGNGTLHTPVGLANATFGKALSLTRAALNNPETRKTDDTLMTILILGMHERLTARLQSRLPSLTHYEGALALIEHRGDFQYNDDLSKRLLIAIRSQHVVYAFEKGEPVSRESAIWKDPPDMPENAAIQQISLSADAADLQTRMEHMFMKADMHTENLDQTLVELLEHAYALDARLVNWSFSLPSSWLPIKVFDVNIPDSVKQAGLYGKTCDVYLDIWMATSWNHHRQSRIIIQSIILQCISLLPAASTLYSPQLTRSVIQEMADGICDSVPFLLGNRTRFGSTGQEIETILPEHQKSATDLGGWLFLVTLKRMVEDRLPLREGQYDWMQQQLERLEKIFFIRKNESSSTPSESSTSSSLNSLIFLNSF